MGESMSEWPSACIINIKTGILLLKCDSNKITFNYLLEFIYRYKMDIKFARHDKNHHRCPTCKFDMTPNECKVANSSLLWMNRKMTHTFNNFAILSESIL